MLNAPTLNSVFHVSDTIPTENTQVEIIFGAWVELTGKWGRSWCPLVMLMFKFMYVFWCICSNNKTMTTRVENFSEFRFNLSFPSRLQTLGISFWQKLLRLQRQLNRNHLCQWSEQDSQGEFKSQSLFMTSLSFASPPGGVDNTKNTSNLNLPPTFGLHN